MIKIKPDHLRTLDKPGIVNLPDPTHTRQHLNHWENIAQRWNGRTGWGQTYHQRLNQIYQNLAPAGLRVLDLGCGSGDLLAALQPAFGVGIDFSAAMLHHARRSHPALTFVQADVHALPLQGTFDLVILSDLLNEVWDVQTLFEEVSRLLSPNGRVILNSYSRLWELPLWLAQKLGLARPTLPGNWLTVADIVNLENLAGIEALRTWQEILLPLPIPLLGPFLNKFLVKIWPFNHFALTNFVLARNQSSPRPRLAESPGVSVIVPARNEAGNIANIINRVPQMGAGTELIFVEGNSSDDTYQIIQSLLNQHPHILGKLFKQNGVGKGDAVRLGFSKASGDVLMILDADLTVPPEDLPRFYEALVSGKGDFINGVRLVYPMEKQAMRFLNFIGNKFFTLAFSWLLDQSIKDTLCGTKVLWRSDYEQIAANRAYFGDFDPFGDFDLIFGAVKLNRKIIDLPIRYRERKYGTTNIQRWKHGWLLIKMVAFAAARIKFV